MLVFITVVGCQQDALNNHEHNIQVKFMSRQHILGSILLTDLYADPDSASSAPVAQKQGQSLYTGGLHYDRAHLANGICCEAQTKKPLPTFCMY